MDWGDALRLAGEATRDAETRGIKDRGARV